MEIPKEVEDELIRLKHYRPFRQWCALRANGEWTYWDSKRKALTRGKKSGDPNAILVCTEK